MAVQKKIEELTDRELQESLLKTARLSAKRLKSIDGNTSFLFWLGLLGLVGAILSFFI